MNTLKLDKTGNWLYDLSITPSTPAETIKLGRLTYTHSEYSTQFENFQSELSDLIKSNIPPKEILSYGDIKQSEKYIHNYLYVQEEVLIGHTSVCFVIKFIFGNDVGIHKFTDEFFKSFEEKIVKYFDEYYISVFGKFNT